MKKNHLFNRLPYLFIAFLLFSLSASAQVGIGTTSPTTTLDVDGAVSYRDGGTLSLSNGNNTDINLGGIPYSNYRIVGPTTSFNVNSIIPISGSDGQIVTLQNTTNAIMNISHDSGGAAANRVLVPGAKDLQVRGQYATISLQYSANQSRWVVLNKYNHVETWYYPPTNIAPGTTTLTGTIPGVTGASSVSVNFIGTLPAWSSNLYLEYIESRNGAVVFRVYNNTWGTTYTNLQFAITVNKI